MSKLLKAIGHKLGLTKSIELVITPLCANGIIRVRSDEDDPGEYQHFESPYSCTSKKLGKIPLERTYHGLEHLADLRDGEPVIIEYEHTVRVVRDYIPPNYDNKVIVKRTPEGDEIFNIKKGNIFLRRHDTSLNDSLE